MSDALAKIILLSTTAVLLAAVLAVLLTGVGMGKNIAGTGYEMATEVYEQSYDINAARWRGVTIPLAAVPAILRLYKDNIRSLNCGICGVLSEGSGLGECLAGHLTGRGLLTLTEDILGGYTAALQGAAP